MDANVGSEARALNDTHSIVARHDAEVAVVDLIVVIVLGLHHRVARKARRESRAPRCAGLPDAGDYWRTPTPGSARPRSSTL